MAEVGDEVKIRDSGEENRYFFFASREFAGPGLCENEEILNAKWDEAERKRQKLAPIRDRGCEPHWVELPSIRRVLDT